VGAGVGVVTTVGAGAGVEEPLVLDAAVYGLAVSVATGFGEVSLSSFSISVFKDAASPPSSFLPSVETNNKSYRQ
jgi:hypothetical protein